MRQVRVTHAVHLQRSLSMKVQIPFGTPFYLRPRNPQATHSTCPFKTSADGYGIFNLASAARCYSI